jgi:hypothetical protein
VNFQLQSQQNTPLLFYFYSKNSTQNRQLIAKTVSVSSLVPKNMKNHKRAKHMKIEEKQRKSKHSKCKLKNFKKSIDNKRDL